MDSTVNDDDHREVDEYLQDSLEEDLQHGLHDDLHHEEEEWIDADSFKEFLDSRNSKHFMLPEGQILDIQFCFDSFSGSIIHFLCT